MPEGKTKAKSGPQPAVANSSFIEDMPRLKALIDKNPKGVALWIHPKTGDTIIGLMSAEGHTKPVAQLLGKVDPKLRRYLLTQPDKLGVTPYQWAEHYEHVNTQEELLSQAASIGLDLKNPEGTAPGGEATDEVPFEKSAPQKLLRLNGTDSTSHPK